MSEQNSRILNDKDVDLISVIADHFTIIPFASIAITSYRSISQLREDEFDDKLQFFLENFKASDQDKIAFTKKLEKDSLNFFKRLMRIIDRIEDKAKVPIIAKLLTHTIQGQISVEEFKRLSTIIDNTYIATLQYMSNLEELPDFASYDQKKFRIRKPDETIRENDTIDRQQLVAIGFLIERPNSYTELQHGTNKVTEGKDYFLTTIGRKFVEYGLEAKIKSGKRPVNPNEAP